MSHMVAIQVTSKLEPLDILQLSRVSKHFRSLFMASTSRHIWVAARRNIPGLPDCPPDLNEAQYAYLLFEKVCFVCSVRIPVSLQSLRTTDRHVGVQMHSWLTMRFVSVSVARASNKSSFVSCAHNLPMLINQWKQFGC